jgi:hypothetical protein
MAQLRSDIQLNCAQFLGAIGQVNEAVEGVKSQFRSALVQLAFLREAFETVTEAVDKVREAVDLGAEMKDLSLATGQPVRDLVVLRQAFENCGMGADGVQMPLARLQKALAGTNEDGLDTTGVFQRLGLSISQLRSESAIEQLTSLQKAFAGISDASERTGLAMQLFGKRGAQMLALLMDKDAIETAKEQVGGLGETLEANAEKFHQFAVAINGVKTKMLEFTAAIAGNLADGGFLEKLSKMDFTGIGASIGSALSGAAKDAARLATAARELAPILIGIGAAMAMNSIKARLFTLSITEIGTSARIAGIGMMTMTQVINKARVQMDLLTIRIQAQNVTLLELLATARVTFMGMLVAAREAAAGIIAAFGPVGIALTAATFIYGKMLEKQAQMEAMISGSNAVNRETEDLVKRNAAMLANVSSEQDRTDAAKSLAEQLDDVHEKLKHVDDDYANLDDSGKATVTQGLQIQADSIALQQKELSKIPDLVMRARAEEKARAEALAESAQQAAKLRTEMAGLLDAYDKKQAIAQRGSDSADDQRQDVLNSLPVQGADENWIAAKIKELRDKPEKSDDELVELKQLIDASEQLDEINKKRKEAGETTQAAAAKIAILKAELDGNSRLIESLEREQKIIERTKQLRQAGVSNPEAEARKEVEAEAAVQAQTAQRAHALKMEGIAAELAGDQTHLAALEDAEKLQQRIAELRKQGDPNADQDAAAEQAGERALRNKKRGEYEQNFALDSARLLAEARGDTKSMREIDHQKRVGELTKEMVGAGVDKDQASKLAETRASLEESLKGDGSPAASALRRIGGGGGAGGGDPAMAERRKQSTLMSTMVDQLKELNKKIKADSNPQINTGVFAYP